MGWASTPGKASTGQKQCYGSSISKFLPLLILDIFIYTALLHIHTCSWGNDGDPLPRVLISARKLAPVPDSKLHHAEQNAPASLLPHPVSKRLNGSIGKPCNSCPKFSGVLVPIDSFKLFFFLNSFFSHTWGKKKRAQQKCLGKEKVCVILSCKGSQGRWATCRAQISSSHTCYLSLCAISKAAILVWVFPSVLHVSRSPQAPCLLGWYYEK